MYEDEAESGFENPEDEEIPEDVDLWWDIDELNERLAAAEEYRKNGGKYLTIDEFAAMLDAAIARGATYARSHQTV